MPNKCSLENKPCNSHTTRRSYTLFFFLFTLFLLTAYNLQLNATIRYVSKTGLSIPPYISWKTAADSIQKCINISVFGDTIYVANGVYKERVDMIPGLTLVGSGMDSCIIDSREFTYSSGFYTVMVSDSCYFAGFQIITYDNTHGFGIYILDWNIEFVNATVENNRILEAQTGININTSSLGIDNDYKLIRMNFITNVQVGIAIAQTMPIVKDNLIFAKERGLYSQIISSPVYIDNAIMFTNNIGIAGFYDFGSNSKVKNNLFYGRGNYGLWTYGDSIANNVVFGLGGYWGRGIFGAGSDIRNNHIERTQTGLYYDAGGGSPPVFKYNNLWRNQSNYQNFSGDTTNIYFDPMFVNPDSMDFHLQKYSPLIDAGDPNIFDKDSTRSDIGLFGGPFGESYIYIDLPPRPPVNLTAEVDSNIITLRWNRNLEADFNYYNLYRDTVKNFTIDSTKLEVSLEDTIYQYLISAGAESLYFKLTAVDNQENESSSSEEVEIIITSINDYPMTINDYQLYQNYPNPFNPSTKIGYKLKERGYVKLYVYDIKGELVSVLVNQTREAGYYEVEFNASVGSGQSAVGNGHSGLSGINGLASGVYIYQIMVRNENDIPVFSDVKKMIYLK